MHEKRKPRQTTMVTANRETPRQTSPDGAQSVAIFPAAFSIRLYSLFGTLCPSLVGRPKRQLSKELFFVPGTLLAFGVQLRMHNFARCLSLRPVPHSPLFSCFSLLFRLVPFDNNKKKKTKMHSSLSSNRSLSLLSLASSS